MSEPIVVHQTEQISVFCRPELSLIEHVMHKPITEAPLQTALLAGAAAMKTHKATKWLSDDRNNGPLSAAHVKWSSEIWFPQVKEAGWKFWALVQPESLIFTLNLKKLVWSYTDQGVTAEVFSDPVKARAWILAQK
jgi:hypothetical protein